MNGTHYPLKKCLLRHDAQGLTMTKSPMRWQVQQTSFLLPKKHATS